jgi:hypothetical protein
MNANVGGLDRGLRVVIGVAVLSLYFFLDGNAKYWSLIGIVPLLTAAIGYCPLYSILGIKTCPVKTGNAH